MGFFDFINSPELADTLRSYTAGDPDRGFQPGAYSPRNAGLPVGQPPSAPQAPVDAFGSVPPEPPKQSVMDRIWGSLGIKPDAIGALASGMPQMPQPAPQSGMDMAADQHPTVNAPMPMARPNIPPDQAAAMIKPVPMPPGAPGQIPPLTNVSLDEAQRMAPPGPSGFTQQNGQQVPMFGQPGRAAPMPPGVPGAPMNIQPPAAQQPSQQQGFLDRMLGGVDKRKFEKFLAGVGKGAANIQGNGRFASAARGFGQGVEGAQGRGDEQFKQQLQANTQKLAVDKFEQQKPVWMSQANYFQARARQQESLQRGLNANQSWRLSPYGRVQMAEKGVENQYNKQMDLLKTRALGMDSEELKTEVAKLNSWREQATKDAYRKYNVHPDANGTDDSHPMDVSRMNSLEFMGMPHGTYYLLPGSKTKDNPQGIVKIRDWDENPPPGYRPGIGWDTGE